MVWTAECTYFIGLILGIWVGGRLEREFLIRYPTDYYLACRKAKEKVKPSRQ